MITGDHKDTAVAIAKELGIITDASQAITGAELNDIPDDQICEAVRKYGVYARVQPEHKTRIVNAWKANDAITAMTGDGVNDAPSIKSADIGVGMGITGIDAPAERQVRFSFSVPRIQGPAGCLTTLRPLGYTQKEPW